MPRRCDSSSTVAPPSCRSSRSAGRVCAAARYACSSRDPPALTPRAWPRPRTASRRRCPALPSPPGSSPTTRPWWWSSPPRRRRSRARDSPPRTGSRSWRSASATAPTSTTRPGSRARGPEPVRALAAGGSGVRAYDDLGGGLEALLDPPAADAWAAALLAPLDEPGERADLAATLLAWLSRHGQVDAAATDLGVHRHTVSHRLRRAEALLGRSLDDAGVRAEPSTSPSPASPTEREIPDCTDGRARVRSVRVGRSWNAGAARASYGRGMSDIRRSGSPAGPRPPRPSSTWSTLRRVGRRRPPRAGRGAGRARCRRRLGRAPGLRRHHGCLRAEALCTCRPACSTGPRRSRS